MSLGILALAFIVIVVLQIFTSDMGPIPTLLSYAATALIVIGLIRIIEPQRK
ncbi:hypothetical protein FM102_01500 [Corynebacterium glutamicum]|nr:hypothetical protein FM102_01500 [Corynebacterium glutamicum]